MVAWCWHPSSVLPKTAAERLNPLTDVVCQPDRVKKNYLTYFDVKFYLNSSLLLRQSSASDFSALKSVSVTVFPGERGAKVSGPNV